MMDWTLFLYTYYNDVWLLTWTFALDLDCYEQDFFITYDLHHSGGSRL